MMSCRKEDGDLPLVSIVFLSWNRNEDLLSGLQHIAADDYPNLEIIVVDNGSHDGTPDRIAKHFPAVKLIALQDNIGVAAYNKGFQAATGEYVLILDDDSFPAHGALRRMAACFEADPLLGIVAFDVRSYSSYDDVCTTDSTGQGDIEAASARYLMGFNGAGAGVRKQAFERAGYYPDEFFLYMNEMDLSLRVMDAGYRIASFADIVAYHKNSPVNRTSWRAPFFYTRNTFWVIWKNYPWRFLVPKTGALCYHVLYFSLEQRTLIYLKALWDAIRNIEKIVPLRRPITHTLAASVRFPLTLSFTFYR